ncbi:hypothetical protein [Egbenema bharatensis]|uniref:hypothetical protein n=1 Tax=Egbenema bharatensis TaxID=3463334 RepID=UPI003A84F9DE
MQLPSKKLLNQVRNAIRLKYSADRPKETDVRSWIQSPVRSLHFADWAGKMPTPQEDNQNGKW